jgi:hypothetical protein
MMGRRPAGNTFRALARYPATSRRISFPTGLGVFYKAVESQASSG